MPWSRARPEARDDSTSRSTFAILAIDSMSLRRGHSSTKTDAEFRTRVWATSGTPSSRACRRSSHDPRAIDAKGHRPKTQRIATKDNGRERTKLRDKGPRLKTVDLHDGQIL